MSEILDVERALLAAAIVEPGDAILRHIVTSGVRPEAFSIPRHQRIMTAVQAIHDDGGHVDAVTVAAALAAQGVAKDQIDRGLADVISASWSTGAIRQYLRLILYDSVWRRRTIAAHELTAAVQARDSDRLALAEQALVTAAEQQATRNPEPEALAHRFLDRLERPDKRRWPFPLDRLNKLTRGGMRPGQVTFVSGATNHGKSPFLDQCLESAAAAGALCRLYMTEMTEHERMARTAARNTGVSLDFVNSEQLSGSIAKKLAGWAAGGGPAFAMIEAAGWTASDITRDARYRRANVIGVDLLDELPLLPGMKRRETTEESFKTLVRFAMQAEAHVIVAGHLNRSRLTGSAAVPVPTLGDIRETGQIANGSNYVVFVWREQDDKTGKPMPDGLVLVAKARGGEQGAVRTYFDGAHQRWLQQDDRYQEEAA